jgi:mRNA capping enzyme/mRNA capping enzyme, catalytic domain
MSSEKKHNTPDEFEPTATSRQNNKSELLYLCEQYLKDLTNRSDERKYYTPELEIRFGTKGFKRITKLDYDNVIKKLTTDGFVCDNLEGEVILKITTEFLDPVSGMNKLSNIRNEIYGIQGIQEYCKTNDIVQIMDSKQWYKLACQKKIFKNKPIDYSNYNFRVSYSDEEKIKMRSPIAQSIYKDWMRTKKYFRYMNRVTYTKPGLPFKFDLSIVKSSSKIGTRVQRTYTIGESGVFDNPESYEIEIEAINDEIIKELKTPEQIEKMIKQVSLIILSGIQCSNYPMGLIDQKNVMKTYLGLLHNFKEAPEYKYDPKIEVNYLHPITFIGPQSKTLQLKNIAPNSNDTNIPNITKPGEYCVTDKADGERSLMIINDYGDIYLINSNMNVINTGAKTYTKECFNTILDGELILNDKEGRYINTYAAFDIYFINHSDIRSKPFIDYDDERNKNLITCRLAALNEVINKLDPMSIVMKKDAPKNVFERRYYKESPINITVKQFYPYIRIKGDKEQTIFQACNFLMKKIKDGLYPYNTDGLIFTPTKLGVGSNVIGEAGPLLKTTWEHSFKWKPAEYNTIDFLVSTKKNTSGEDIIGTIYEAGVDMTSTTELTQFKTLILRCGFDEKKHGYLNPCQDVIDDKLPEFKDENEDNFRPVRFYPTEPYDQNAGICNVPLKYDDTRTLRMFTEEEQVFDDDTIIEFKYDINRKDLFKWVPIRVRYDKTSDYKQGLKNYGNSYNVANDNWYSIHNPVTIEMLTTGKNIPNLEVSDDVYYNASDNKRASLTKGLRDFHNLYVKKKLILGVSKRGDTLIDYACGKGGDFPKWIDANLSFVFGIDISKDNLENRLNGACARFLNFRREYKHMPYALFVNGNSSLNVKSGQAMFNDKARDITKAVFGLIPKNTNLGKGVERQYGKASTGFNVSSCQFAIHYMFESKNTFYNFMRNLAECTKINGYFICTSYDGKLIFNKFRTSKRDSLEITEKGVRIWKVTKKYTNTEFNDDESSLGYKIDVFQESINQVISEYLVNFAFLTRMMENYGFTIVNRDEARNMNLPQGSALFSELYDDMEYEIKRNPDLSVNYKEAPMMTRYEKEISFYNRYAIFKKINTVDAEKLTRNFLSQLPDEVEYEKKNTQKLQEYILEEEEEEEKVLMPKAKKLNKKIQLVPATEAADYPVISSTTTAKPTTVIPSTTAIPTSVSKSLGTAIPTTATFAEYELEEEED